METIGVALSMLAAVIVSAILVRAIPIAVPTPLVQIALGAAMASVLRHEVQLDPEIFFLLFLPPLLFLDGWRISKEGLLRDKSMILELALGLVFCTVICMGFFFHWMIPAMPLSVAFALAAIVAPTDPVALSAITARVSIPKRAMHVLEGESLLNDASGLVCFRFAVAAALTGAFSVSEAALTFVQLALVGVGVGTILTYAVMQVKHAISRRLGEEAGSQVLISVLMPFGAHELAEYLGGSGILAAVAAGITMSYMELSGRALAITRVHRTAVWDTVQFALNGVMFVVLGEQLPGILSRAVEAVERFNHLDPWWLLVYAVAGNLGLACLRFLWVWISFRLAAFLPTTRGGAPVEKPTLRLIAAMSVAGVRGAITLAGVLSLPVALADGTTFPMRDLAIFVAASVVIVSLTTASVTLPRLLRALALPSEPPHEAEIDRARSDAAEAAIRAIEEASHTLASGRRDADLHAEAAARVMDLYRRRIEGQTTGEDAARVRRCDDIEQQLRLAGLRAERDRLFALARAHAISDENCRKLVREIDLLEERLR